MIDSWLSHRAVQHCVTTVLSEVAPQPFIPFGTYQCSFPYRFSFPCLRGALEPGSFMDFEYCTQNRIRNKPTYVFAVDIRVCTVHYDRIFDYPYESGRNIT